MTLFKRAISPKHHRYQYIGKVEECIERIARIVKQLYQLNRPEPPIFQSNDISDTVRNGVEIMKDLSAKRGIKVISRLPSTPIAAKISQSDVIQVLCNLIQNALDVSQPEDKNFHFRRSSDRIRLRSESGIRAPVFRQKSRRIFSNPFSRRNQDRQRRRDGTGVSHIT